MESLRIHIRTKEPVDHSLALELIQQVLTHDKLDDGGYPVISATVGNRNFQIETRVNKTGYSFHIYDWD
jgi:hypothetical protein